MSRRDVCIAVICALIWGATFPAIKWLSYIAPPFFMTAMRFSIIGLAIFFVSRPKDVSLLFFLIYAVLLGCGQYFLSAYSIYSGLSPGVASVLMQLQVYITILLGWLLMSEHIGKKNLAGISVGFVGLIWFIYINTNMDASLIGLISVLLATTSWAIINIMLKSNKVSSIISLVVWSSLINGPLLLLTSYSTGEFAQISFSVDNLLVFSGLVGFLGFIGTLYVSIKWGELMRRYNSYLVVPFSILIPIFGFSMSWIIFDDISEKEMLPVVLVMVGLAIVLYNKKSIASMSVSRAE